MRLLPALVPALAAAFTLAALPAFADDTSMSGATVKVAGPAGEVTYTFDPNGTFTTSSGQEGLWRVSGEKVCIQPTGGAEECELNAGATEAGKSWQQAYKGGTATVTVVQVQ